jgi:hypothetical protein
VLQSIFKLDGVEDSISSVVTPGMIRSCNMVARGTLMKQQMQQMRQARDAQRVEATDVKALDDGAAKQ